MARGHGLLGAGTLRRGQLSAAAVAALVLAGCGAGHSRQPQPLRVAVHADGLVEQIATAIPVAPDTVVTVEHVLEGAAAISVGGRPATVVQSDLALDIAVLRVHGLHASLSPLAPRRPATRVVLVRGARDQITRASLIRRVTARVQRAAGSAAADRRPVLELSATVEPGDSGAPVTDSDGRVVGMIFARSSESPGTAWAVDAPAIATVLAQR
jgi:S1-C subfamily serine protease